MLNGKVAVVTGGSRGIGRAAVLKLAEAGADVAIIYASNAEAAESVKAEAEGFGVRAEIFACDASDYAAVKSLASEIKRSFGGVDILVNNAGVNADGLLLMMSEEAFDRVLDTNLKGCFNMTRHFAALLMRRGGKIVNVSSVAALRGNAGQSNYCASKAGMIGFTRAVARELASRGVCCNAVAPGLISTDMTENLSTEDAILKQIPLGRKGLPEDVANAVLFLASDAASYITGEVLRVDGGIGI